MKWVVKNAKPNLLNKLLIISVFQEDFTNFVDNFTFFYYSFLYWKKLLLAVLKVCKKV